MKAKEKSVTIPLKAFILSALVAPSLLAETWTFTEPGGDNNYWSHTNCWVSQEGGTNGVPRTGDCLEILVKPSSMHRAELNAYMKRIHFGPNAGQNTAHSGYFIQGVEQGGEGLLWEPTTGFSLWAGIWSVGNGIVNIKSGGLGSLYFRGKVWETDTGEFKSYKTGRIIKLGPGYLSTANDATFANWRGADINEGTITFNSVNNLTKPEFYFYGDKANAILAFVGCGANFAGGYIHSSTNELPATNHGITDNQKGNTLTLSGDSPVDEQYYEGTFMGSLSFVWNPSDSSKRFTIARNESTTAGSLTVQNGTLCITNGASFTQLSTVTAENTGVLDIAADAGAIKTMNLNINDSAKIRLNGRTMTLNSVCTNGAPLADGSYTAENISAIIGAGTLVVNSGLVNKTPVEFTVAVDTTMTLAEAIAAYNAATNDESQISIDYLNGGDGKLRPIRKLGKGRLDLNVAIPNYKASVYVEEGVLYTACRYALGQEANPDCAIYVRKGATFSTDTYLDMNCSRTFHIAGEGAGKVGAATYHGALHCGATRSGWGNMNAFGKTIILDDDARVYLGNWMGCGSGEIYLNGHTLTARGVDSRDSPFFLPPTIADDGKIIVEWGQWKINGSVTFNGTDPNNTVTFKHNGGWRFADTATGNIKGNGAKVWKFVFAGDESYLYTDYNIQPRGVNKNRLEIDTVLDTMVRLCYQSDRCRGYLQISQPVLGKGGFASTDNRTAYLHLLSSGNTFTGGLDFTRGTVWVYANGAVPYGENAGKVRLAPTLAPYVKTKYGSDGKLDTSSSFINTFDGIAFMQNDVYQLPDLEAAGKFPSRVQGGQGAWRTITQKGNGLDYYSGLGADLLNVESGYVKLPRGANPGLWEGETTTDAATAYATTVTYTNYAVRGPTAIIPYEAYNYTSWKNNELITYSGYVWNRTDGEATWTFALAPKDGSAKLLVNGETVVEGDATAPKAGSVVLKPGANRFECRLLNAKGARAASATWPEYFGCAYDPLGRGDITATNNFIRAVDTGDGSLFTRTAETSANLPDFKSIRLAAGTRFDVNGNRFVAQDIAGAGTVTNSASDATVAPALVIEKSLTVNAAVAETLQIAVPLELGENFKLCVTNCANRLRGRRTVLCADDKMTLNAASIPVVSDDGKLWTASLSADGRSIDLRREGLLIFLK